QAEQILDDFEHNDINKYELNHQYVKTYDVAISDEFAKHGDRSMMLSYHFGGWTSGNGAMYIIFKENLTAVERPFKLGLWVYGDGKSPWLRATLIDGLNDRKTVNLTDGNIDWIGWKYLDVAIDSGWHLPIKLEQIYAVEVDKAYRGRSTCKGVIYVDHIRFV